MADHSLLTPGWSNPFEAPSRTSEVLNSDKWRWVDGAACNGTDPELWFSDGTAHHAKLRAICDQCPVRESCLEHALTDGEYGWWGGTSSEDRRQLRRRRR